MNFISLIILRIKNAYNQIITSKNHTNTKSNTPQVDNILVDKVYLINLKRRIDRLVDFKKKYDISDMSNIEYNIIEAVDGSTLDIDKIPLSEVAKTELQQVEYTGYRHRHYQLTKGAIGCYLSHINVWNDIMDNNVDIALVFEDDANIPPNMKSIVNYTLQTPKIPSDWDILLLGFLCNICHWDDTKVYSKVERFMLTHCYIIRKEAIKKILDTDTLFPITQQIDAYLSELSSIVNIYTIDKTNKVKQNNSRTDIQIPLLNKKDPAASNRMHIDVKNKNE